MQQKWPSSEGLLQHWSCILPIEQWQHKWWNWSIHHWRGCDANFDWQVWSWGGVDWWGWLLGKCWWRWSVQWCCGKGWVWRSWCWNMHHQLYNGEEHAHWLLSWYWCWCHELDLQATRQASHLHQHCQIFWLLRLGHDRNLSTCCLVKIWKIFLNSQKNHLF